MADEAIYPSRNPYLIGHDEEVRLFLSAYNSGALHHGWLITGDEGIGKATLAYKIARFLLAAETGKLTKRWRFRLTVRCLRKWRRSRIPILRCWSATLPRRIRKS